MIDSSIHDKKSKGKAASELVNSVTLPYHLGLRVSPFFYCVIIRRLSIFVCKTAATAPGNSRTFDTVDRNKKAYFFALSFRENLTPKVDLLQTRILLFVA